MEEEITTLTQVVKAHSGTHRVFLTGRNQGGSVDEEKIVGDPLPGCRVRVHKEIGTNRIQKMEVISGPPASSKTDEPVKAECASAA